MEIPENSEGGVKGLSRKGGKAEKWSVTHLSQPHQKGQLVGWSRGPSPGRLHGHKSSQSILQEGGRENVSPGSPYARSHCKVHVLEHQLSTLPGPATRPGSPRC